METSGELGHSNLPATSLCMYSHRLQLADVLLQHKQPCLPKPTSRCTGFCHMLRANNVSTMTAIAVSYRLREWTLAKRISHDQPIGAIFLVNRTYYIHIEGSPEQPVDSLFFVLPEFIISMLTVSTDVESVSSLSKFRSHKCNSPLMRESALSDIGC